VNLSRRSVLKLSLLATGLLSSGLALAAAEIDPLLSERLASALPGERLEVVISFAQSDAPRAGQIAALQQIGIESAVSMQSLPIAGALATPNQIQALAARADVASIYFNAPLQYMNLDSRRISGAARAVDNPGDFGRVLPFSGRGVTVLVNDSGVDASHMDLSYGNHVVENVQGLTNLRAVSGLLPVTYLEGQLNTDLGSGHGTHCAGTIGGTGERSAGAQRGVAPGADLVGYGSGAVLLILDAVGGIDYAVTNQFRFPSPIRIISNSWGSSGPFQPLNPVNIATYEAYKRGIVSVFAAGNDGPGENTHNPYAQAPWVISVGAGDKQGRLASFSSRGNRGESGSFTMPDGQQWTYVNEPTVVATGVDVISTRALSGALPPLATPEDVEMIPPAQLPFYTVMSGTSMATPHVAGIAALVLEANPNLGPLQLKELLQRTASNMSGRESWEVGAGHVDAYAALIEAAGLRGDFGDTVNASRSFNANALLQPGAEMPFSVDFSPVGPTGSMNFEVGPDTAWVTARASIGSNTLAVVLIDPDGQRYGSAIALPLLGSTVVASAPAKPGTWTVTVRGVGSVSGVPLDPVGATNGYGLPGTVTGRISLLDSAGFTGLGDIATHEARGAIEFAVSRRLVDGYSDARFRPDQNLRRSELADYLVMGASLRQRLPGNGGASFGDVSLSHPAYAFVEAATARGGALRDLDQGQNGAIRPIGGSFKPNQAATRLDLAYALVQGLALQHEAEAFSGEMTAFFDGKRVPVLDASSIPANLRGHAQLALDAGLINARFALKQGPFDLQPTLVAYFDPSVAVTRAAYAVAAGRYLSQYQQ
jgi:serine protease AprX